VDNMGDKLGEKLQARAARTRTASGRNIFLFIAPP
jgi:hypothetical protein